MPQLEPNSSHAPPAELPLTKHGKLCPSCHTLYTSDDEEGTGSFCGKDGAFLVASDRVFAGKYLLGERLGFGQMSEVWSALQSGVGRQVALKILRRSLADGEPNFPALQQATESVFDARIGDISGRGKLAADMREIWTMQPRFERRIGNAPLTLVEQPRFRAGFDFLRLRGQVGEIDPALATWWESFSLADPTERRELLEDAREEETAKRQARAADGDFSSAGSGAPAKKRRRRRRKPEGGSGAGSAPE